MVMMTNMTMVMKLMRTAMAIICSCNLCNDHENDEDYDDDVAGAICAALRGGSLSYDEEE